MSRQQPADEWDFVPADDDEEPAAVAPEVTAIHISRRPSRTPARDRGRSDVDLGEADTEATALGFDDEEPEIGAAPLDDRREDADVDLEDLLESQHYSFDADAGDGADRSEKE
jgi:hypothetical protein